MASSSPSPRLGKYDVFLSFRGEDTGKGFVSHLCEELKQWRLDYFLDEPDNTTGNAISDELLNAINQSRASIVVISKDYASSSWVLDGLLEILRCKEKNKQIVVPVFYEVDPSHVRKQTGSFEGALEEHETKFREGKDTLELARNIKKIQDWKTALNKIASIKGWDSRDRPESKLVEQICRDIWKQLHSTLPVHSKEFVGMGRRIEEMEHLLDLSSKEVRMVGILGVGGIGKTTIATAVCEKLKSRFDMHCIVNDVKKVCKERNMSGVQKLLLSKLFNIEEAKIRIEGVTSNVIKERLCRKKVLIVLDDLDHLEQLSLFAKETSWFGPCSRIIITTRDEKILTANHVGHVYKVRYLDEPEALQIFNQFAFRQTDIPNGFKELSNRAVTLAHGLPLALKVLGSHLYGENEIHWERHLRKLESFPHPDIMEVLKTSYYSLDGDSQIILLYAACDLYHSLNDGKEVTDACGYHTESKLHILVQKSLISFSRFGGRVRMHDLVQQMGRNIVHGEFRRRPGRYKMLWDTEDISQVLSDGTGTEAVEGILFNWSEYSCRHVIHVTPEAFKGMTNLKFLIFHGVVGWLHFFNGLEWLPCSLNFVWWDEYSFTTLPVNFLPINLVELHMPSSRLEKLWEGIKPLGKLKVMDLSDSKQLKIMPDLSNATSLEHLLLCDCKSLVELSRLPPNLQFLDLNGCSQLKAVNSRGPLVKLKEMNLSYCGHLERMPDLSNATTLESLDLRYCKSLVEVSMLPPNLRFVNLKGCSELQVVDSREPLVKLKEMNLSSCGHLKKTPDLSNATSLESLHLRHCKSLVEVSILPPNLQFLNLKGCSKLHVVDSREPLGKLKWMNLSSCGNLKRTPDLSNATSLQSLCLRRCKNLVEVSAFLPNLQFLSLEGCTELEVVHCRGLPVKLKMMNLSYCEHLKRTPDLSDATELKLLNFINCKSLVEFPKLANEAMIGLVDLSIDCSLLSDNLSCLISLKKLKVKGMELQQIPSSIMCLRNLEDLQLEGRDDSGPEGIGWCCPSLSALCNLTSLWLINLDIQRIPDDLDQLHELSSLDLSGNNFEELPVSIKNLSSLVRLTLKNCKRLKALPELPRRHLKAVYATDCTSLEQIHVDTLPKYSHFMNCFKLENSAQLMVESMTWNRTEMAICLTGSEIPEWFGPESSGVSGVPCVARDTVGFLSCILLPSESVRTFCARNIRCYYRFISESEAREVYCKRTANFFTDFSRDADILHGDHLLVWYCKFTDAAVKADATYDQVFFNFSVGELSTEEIEDEARSYDTPLWKAERFGVQMLFREPKDR